MKITRIVIQPECEGAGKEVQLICRVTKDHGADFVCGAPWFNKAWHHQDDELGRDPYEIAAYLRHFAEYIERAADEATKAA